MGNRKSGFPKLTLVHSKTPLMLRKTLTAAAILLLIASSYTAEAQRRGRRTATRVTTERKLSFLEVVDSLSYKTVGLPQPEAVEEVEPSWSGTGNNEDLDKLREADAITKGINTKNECDAYPFLSSDGLRMYFTTNRGKINHGQIFISERRSVNEPFANPRPLSVNLPDPFYSSSLTADELTLYTAKDGKIYVTKRRSLKEDFSKPELVDLGKLGWTFAPGISPDGNELVVTTHQEGRKGEVNIVFRKTGDRFVQQEILASPEGSDAGPAQFSKDGLSIYCSREDVEGSDEKLFRYRRSNRNGSFVEVEEVAADLHKHKQCLQPSVNGDESMMAYVISNGAWDQDDILIVPMQGRKDPMPVLPDALTEKGSKPAVGLQPAINYAQAKVYPNPFQDHFIFELSKEPGAGTLLTLFDLNGRQLRQQRISSMKNTISVGELPAGTYFYHVTNSEGKLIASGKVVRG
jgi:hypothetical protein